MLCLTCFAAPLFADANYNQEHAGERSAQQGASQPNCGILSTLSLAQVAKKDVSAELRSQLQKQYPTSTVSMLDVKKMAEQVGIPLSGVQATLDELLALQRPLILHLQQPEHFVLMLDGNKDIVRVLESPDSNIDVLPRAQIEKRFAGYALLPRMQAPSDAPNIKLEQVDYHFGITGVGQNVEYEYRFANVGKSDLKVEIAGSSCGCTGAFLSDKASGNVLTLKPGESSGVKLTYTTAAPGNVQQMVTLQTNDPLRPLVYLSIRGSSPQNVQVGATQLFFSTDKGQSAEKKFRIVGPLGMTLEKPRLDSAFWTAETTLVSTDEIKQTWQVTVRQIASTPVGEKKAMLSIPTNHGDKPTITVPIQSIVRGDLEISPATAFIGFVKVGETKTVDVALRSRSGQTFRVLKTQLLGQGHEWLNPQKTELSASVQHVLRLSLNTAKNGYVDATLRLTTDVKGEEIINIPVNAMIEK